VLRRRLHGVVGDSNHLIELPAHILFALLGAAVQQLRGMRSARLHVWGSGSGLWGRVRVALSGTLGRRLKVFSAKMGRSQDDLLGEAINDVLQKRKG